MRLLWKTTCAGLRVGSGIAAAWITASWPRTTAKAAPASVRSVCTYAASPGVRALEHGRPEIGRGHVVPGREQGVDGGAADLAAAAGHEDAHGAQLAGCSRRSPRAAAVAGGSCRRITLLRLRRLRLRTCPPPPARASSLPAGHAPASRSASVYCLRGRSSCAGLGARLLSAGVSRHRGLPPPLASQRCASGLPRSARRPSG